MKKVTYLYLILVITFSFACGKTGISWIDNWFSKDEEEKTEQTETTEANTWESEVNIKLSGMTLNGFKYKNWSLPMREWKIWKSDQMPKLKQVHDELKEGYVIEITGHADARGPEDPEGIKPGNKKISSSRAEAVYKELIKNDFFSDKLLQRGAGSSEPMDLYDSKDPEQRRVTFRVVKKE